MYEVFVWYASHSSHSSAVPVELFADGTMHSFTLDQTSGGGMFQSLGSFMLRKGQSTSLTVSAGNSGSTTIDAIGVVPI